MQTVKQVHILNTLTRSPWLIHIAANISVPFIRVMLSLNPSGQSITQASPLFINFLFSVHLKQMKCS